MRIGNLPYIITYFLALLLFFLGAIFYRQPLTAVLFLLILLFPPLSFLLCQSAFNRLTFSVSLPEEPLSAGETFCVRIKVHNPTRLPLLNCRLVFSSENLYYPDPREHEMLLPAEAGGDSRFRLSYSTDAAGMFSFRVHFVEVTDLLHLITFRRDEPLLSQIPILPADTQLPALGLTKSPSGAEESIPSPEGELSADLLQVRDYIPGDRLKDAHWKLSARMDELQIKEYERSRELYYVLLPVPESAMLQETISLFYALGKRLLAQGEYFQIALFSPEDHSFAAIPVGNVSELNTALFRLYQLPAPEHSGAYDELLRQSPELSGVIRIEKGRVLLPDAPEVY